MPFVSLPNQVRLAYEETGDESAPPLLLIAPAGSSRTAWEFQVPALAEHFRAVTYDHRATGETEYPSPDFSLCDLADDACWLLDRLGIREVTVVGASMGACVAIELALRHPHRVAALVLASASAGGALAEMSHDERAAMIRSTSELAPGERGMALARLYYGPGAVERNPLAYRTIAESAGWDSERTIDPDGHPHNRAIREFDASHRLGYIRPPTLVVHGDDDVLVPVVDAQRIADAIPRAELLVLRGGHLFFMQSADAFNEAIVAFATGALGGGVRPDDQQR